MNCSKPTPNSSMSHLLSPEEVATENASLHLPTPEEIAVENVKEAYAPPRIPKPTKHTLDDRGKSHGDFSENSETSQAIKCIMRDTRNWGRLAYYQQEALDMIAHKIARILSGNPDFADHWHDIQGYAELVEDRITYGSK